MVKVLKKTDAIRHENTSSCVAYEYNQPTNELDAAVITLSGRYPENGWVLNTACTSLVHVVSGRGHVYFAGSEVELAEDHQVLIERGEKYALEGEMKLLFIASPKWTPEQAKSIL
jgi:hypothetical protein